MMTLRHLQQKSINTSRRVQGQSLSSRPHSRTHYPFPRDNGVEITCSVDSHQAACWGIDPNEPTWYAPKKMKGMTLSQAGQRVHQNFQFAELNVGKHTDAASITCDLC
jgi:hypothetical protein